MAEEYIKKSSGLMPIGNTQGIMVPQGADGLSFVPQGVASASASGVIILKPETVVFARGMTIDANGFFSVKEGDVFLVKFPMLVYTGDSLFNAIIEQYSADKTTLLDSIQTMAYSHPASCWAPCVPHTAAQDGFCRMIFWVGSDVTNVAFTRPNRGSECTITKISKLSPDIIANKGALVSGGSFQFDEDGHGFTKNYFDTETAVGWWRDGRPVYARTFQKTFSATGPVLDILDNSGNIDLIVDENITYKDSSPWSVTGKIYYGGADYSKLAYIVQVTSNGNNINVWRNVVDSGYLDGVFYITAYYVKTTD
jgi:hypothetical protein